MDNAPMTIDAIGFDADDTLWHNEILYRRTEGRFRQLLMSYDVAAVDERMHAREIGNLDYWGYGIKGFILSLIETAIELTAGRVSAAGVGAIVGWGKEMRMAAVDLVGGAASTLAALHDAFPLLLITKGDLLEQQSKVERSGLAGYFRCIDIVNDKSPAVYNAILAREKIVPANFVMVGNSLRSDILPVTALGGRAIYVPSPLTWAHETVDIPDEARARFVELESLESVPGLIARWQASPPG